MMKRIFALWMMLLLVALAAGVAQGGDGIFTDDAGRDIPVPDPVRKVAPSGTLAQMALFALAPERLVGLASKVDPEALAYLGAYEDLPLLGQLYGARGDLNLETLAAADPQLIIDLGDGKESIREDMDALSDQVGIPFVHIGATLETMPEAFRRLGTLLGLEERGEILAAHCEKIYARGEALAKILGDDKRKVVYLVGENGLGAIAKGSYHAEVLDMLCDNVAVVENPSGKGMGNEINLEQLLLWEPEVILFAPGTVYDQVGGMEIWRELAAIREGNYAEVPLLPYNWMGHPPSIQRYLGMLWLPAILYPQLCDYDLYQEVAETFQLFYHHELTQEAFEALMANSRLPQ